MSILKEFKEFAMRGSVVDLAIGVVIGAAFGKVVTSLVNDIIMPPIGILTGGVDFTDKFFCKERCACRASFYYRQYRFFLKENFFGSSGNF